MEYKKMYPASVNSVETTITVAINDTGTVIYVLDGSAIPQPPNLLVLGGALPSAETVKLTAKEGIALTVERAFQGAARPWPIGTTIARSFTAYDYDVLVDNVTILQSDTETSIADINAAFHGLQSETTGIKQNVEKFDSDLIKMESEVIQNLNGTEIELETHVSASRFGIKAPVNYFAVENGARIYYGDLIEISGGRITASTIREHAVIPGGYLFDSLPAQTVKVAKVVAESFGDNRIAVLYNVEGKNAYLQLGEFTRDDVIWNGPLNVGKADDIAMKVIDSSRVITFYSSTNNALIAQLVDVSTNKPVNAESAVTITSSQGFFEDGKNCVALLDDTRIAYVYEYLNISGSYRPLRIQVASISESNSISRGTAVLLTALTDTCANPTVSILETDRLLVTWSEGIYAYGCVVSVDFQTCTAGVKMKLGNSSCIYQTHAVINSSTAIVAGKCETSPSYGMTVKRLEISGMTITVIEDVIYSRNIKEFRSICPVIKSKNSALFYFDDLSKNTISRVIIALDETGNMKLQAKDDFGELFKNINIVNMGTADLKIGAYTMPNGDVRGYMHLIKKVPAVDGIALEDGISGTMVKCIDFSKCY